MSVVNKLVKNERKNMKLKTVKSCIAAVIAIAAALVSTIASA